VGHIRRLGLDVETGARGKGAKGYVENGVGGRLRGGGTIAYNIRRMRP
jgi:hypothetical protein